MNFVDTFQFWLNSDKRMDTCPEVLHLSVASCGITSEPRRRLSGLTPRDFPQPLRYLKLGHSYLLLEPFQFFVR
jgi:hypothetical protein